VSTEHISILFWSNHYLCLKAKAPVKRLLFVLPLLIVGLASCSPSKYVGEGEYLLERNKVLIKGEAENVTSDEMQSLARQRPNRKLLGIFRLNTWAYHKAATGNDNAVNRWLLRSIAKEPVIVDTGLIISSLKQMDLYLQNKGYFSNELDYQIRKKRWSRYAAKVEYSISPGKEYRLWTIRSSVRDTTLALFLGLHFGERILQQGMIYDVDILDDERDRIVHLLKDYGYYSFTREYITYRIDSTLGQGRMDVEMIIANPPGRDHHPRQKIDRIMIYPDFDPLRDPSKAWDTLIVADRRWGLEKAPGLYYFLYDDKLRVKPEVILQNIFIEQGAYYAQQAIQRTYRRLSDLPVFGFVNIHLKELPEKAERSGGGLSCEIRISRAASSAFNIETEGTNSAGDLGVAGSFVFENRNLFRGAEFFQIRLKGALEVQRLPESTDGEFLFFNTFETGAEASLRFPRFLLPLRGDLFPKLFEPYTRLNLAYNVRQRPAYRRVATNISFGYEWKETAVRRHILYPADLNAVDIIADSSFNPSAFGPLYAAQYTDHLTAAIKYSFILNTQPIARGGNYLYFRANLSSAGNFLDFAHNVFSLPEDERGFHSLFNIRYAQYIRFDGDFRYYQIMDGGQSLVYRLAAGMGVPYGNSVVLPFEQAFFSGGSNSLRGWEVRSLGPGAYANPENRRYDKIGDILLEASAEYRFPVYRYLKGALFADAGNIWLQNQDAALPGGEFRISSFASQLALDAGLGMRLDFGFFLFRLDAALPLRDPARVEGARWLRSAEYKMKKVVWNFGIGYPF